MNETPKHRAGFASRDGDTRVIDGSGKLSNLDDAARKKAVAVKATKPSGTKAAGDEAEQAEHKKPKPSDAVSGE